MKNRVEIDIFEKLCSFFTPVAKSVEGPVIIHVDVTFLKIKFPSVRYSTLLHALKLSLSKTIGKKQPIFVPTFTYSFCKTKLFDINHTPSEVGMFSNFLLNQSNVMRTNHPVFSFAGFGQNAGRYAENISIHAFGLGSLFDKVRANNGSIMFLNTSFQSCTFIHHIEQIVGVSYRFDKTFKGKYINGDVIRDCKAVNSVRYKNKNIVTDLTEFETHLLQKGVLKIYSGDLGAIKLAYARDIFNEGKIGLQLNPKYFLRK